MATRIDWHQQVENELCRLHEISNNGNAVSLTVDERQKWKKFGDAAHDHIGINPATTKVGDTVIMDFLSCIDDDALLKYVTQILGVRCRRCSQGHSSAKCPYKDYLPEVMGSPTQKRSQVTTTSTTNDESSTKKYIPPGKRTGYSNQYETAKQDDATVCVSNLPEETEEHDLRDLFRQCGQITRIHLVKDKINNTPKGIVFVPLLRRGRRKLLSIALMALALVL